MVHRQLAKFLLAYQSTLLKSGYCPVELLMSRQLRNTFLAVPEQRSPKVVDFAYLRGRDYHLKERQRQNYNQRHRAKQLASLEPGDTGSLTVCPQVLSLARRSHIVISVESKASREVAFTRNR